MLDFKTYKILQENCTFLEMSVKVKRNKVKFDYNDKDKKELSTTFGKGKFQPYVSKGKNVLGYPVYSVYKYNDSYKTLKALKRQNDVKMDNKEYDQFLNRTAFYLQAKVIPKKTDVIITPQSSSFILDDLVDNLKNRLPHIKFIKSGFTKNKVEDIKLNYDDYDIPDAIKDRMTKILDRAKKKGFLEIKTVPKPYVKFITDFLKSDLKKSYIEDKNIVILDDMMASGFTLKAAIQNILTYSPKSITGISIFKSV